MERRFLAQTLENDAGEMEQDLREIRALLDESDSGPDALLDG